MPLKLYNTLTNRKEIFSSITPKHVGMYVCGPTVSGESHLGHARPYITFDVVYRYLQHLGYKVRYVRNITDAGHFEEEGREAEDKISKKALLEKLEPMELVQKYTNLFHWAMLEFNCKEPSIEPTATGHIVEQIEMIKKIIEAGYAYEKNGSVYFNVVKYTENHKYGRLSNRKIKDLAETTRKNLERQGEKKNKQDFALWKKAPRKHLMRWNSPWGQGFPGWHIECSAMATKYLGKRFDIHGGGMDLLFPHHECEIAQSTVCNHKTPARYWVHNNMITINGRKMGKSYNNVIKLTELFSGDHPLLSQAFHPMVVRFFILQSHYRSPLDFSSEALEGSEKGLKRLWEAYDNLMKIEYKTSHLSEAAKERTPLNSKILHLLNQFDEFMDDDLSSGKVIANMFELAPTINSFRFDNLALEAIQKETFEKLRTYFKLYLEEIFGLKKIIPNSIESKFYESIEYIIELREKAKQVRDFTLSDDIRKRLVEYLGVDVFDYKDGTTEYTFGERKIIKNLQFQRDLIFFDTDRQQTFLMKTTNGISLVLKDKVNNTYQLKWEEPYKFFFNIKLKVKFETKEKYGSLSLGKHTGWLVSKNLFENEIELEKKVTNFLHND